MIKRTSKINVKQFSTGLLLGLLIGVVYNSLMLYFENGLKYELSDETLINRKSSGLNLLNMIGLTNDNKCNYDKNGPRILCAVFTHKANFESKAAAVNKTWGNRCHKTIYISGRLNENEKSSNLNIAYLDIPETNRLNLTLKTISTILYANNHLVDEFDWFLKADDDTYINTYIILMKNLKQFLWSKCPTEIEHYYGFRYFPNPPERFLLDFNLGGAGYILSNNAIKKFSNKYIEDKAYCRDTTGSEDVDLAKCLAEINIKPGDSRDKLGRERFHSLDFKNSWELPQNRTRFEMLHSKFPMKKGEECCSESSISFHYTAGMDALQLDFLLYNLKH